jgi:AraC family transcriptional regulator
LRALTSWVEENLGMPLTIDAMAARVGLSSAHFSREFKRSVGVTPWGYVVQHRLDCARQLMSGGESIGVTAKKCGFSDPSHMSRLFRQRFGVSPLAFIKTRSAERGLRRADEVTLAEIGTR